MKNETKIKIFLVDDDAVFLKLLEIDFLEYDYFTIETFATGEQCIENLSHNPDIIILDFHLDGTVENAMSGLNTLDNIKGFNADIPVIMLSSQDKIEVAISCMHHGAFEYIVKNEITSIRIEKTISAIFQFKELEQKLNCYKKRM